MDIYEKLNKRNLFKLILGLGNKNEDEIKAISQIYSKAGVDIFDITPDVEIFKLVKDTIERQGFSLKELPICVSYPIGDDKHGKKAFVDKTKCLRCRHCIKKCSYGAISFEQEVIIDTKKCIGCEACKCSAITYKKEEIALFESIETFQNYGVKFIELHISTPDIKVIKDTFIKLITKFPDLNFGVCVSREKFADIQLINLLKDLITLYDKKLIIQADGLSMNGGKDTTASTLQAVAIAQLLQELDAYIIISGGTNDKSKHLLDLCNVKANGIAIGSFGRLLIKDEVSNNEFWYNNNTFNSTLAKAVNLVKSVKDNERNN
ncbi:MAG: DUF561 domain-containing protein [Candidatus Gastranaerophilales bacterium]|nr:DUF561 domain-containing protein [Candidatus Gastranaerophilales bacterium]